MQAAENSSVSNNSWHSFANPTYWSLYQVNNQWRQGNWLQMFLRSSIIRVQTLKWKN
jgi:hypothetical protein